VFIDRSRRPADIPAPPSIDEIAARLAVPLSTFISQDHVQEMSAGWNDQTRNGLPVLEAATLSYTLWRNPADHEDPANFAELTPEVRAGLDQEPPSPLPEWMEFLREQMRYPMLWEAVRTTHISDGSVWHSPELAFIEHINYIVMNTFRAQRMLGEFPGELVDEAIEDRIEHGVPLTLDGIQVNGMRYEDDQHIVGVAADLGDRYMTAVIPREHLSLVRLEFKTRPAAFETRS
jgi:hypothetical protein